MREHDDQESHQAAQDMGNTRVHISNVWEVDSFTSVPGHPAACPVEIPYRCLQAYTGAKDTVLDPFGGSGTTLVAAEKSGRRAFLMEKSPAFCDVIIRRWEAMTGKKARQCR